MCDSIKPLVTIVIPTRERADKLKFTLETVLDQENDNFQVVVSDNFSQDNTKEIVDAFADPRVTYVNTGVRLSMSDNWDFAFKHVQGAYVIYIGDDDGLMPGAINKLEEMIKTKPSPIYCWECHEYMWPFDGNPPKIGLIAPVRCSYEIDLNKITRFSLGWGGLRDHLLPRVYYSAVSSSILEAIREKTGRVFHSQAPDLFSGYALPAFSNKAVNVGEALTVIGYSGKTVSAVQRFFREYGNYQFHSTLFPKAPIAINHIQDSTLVAMDMFPEFYAKLKFNYEAMWANMVWSGRYQRTLYIPESKLSSVFHLLCNRKEIRIYHPFRVTSFLFYCLINALLRLRADLKRKIKGKKIDGYGYENDSPQNIYAFVKLVRQIESQGSI
jgi:glycosyltransferase involved in cell wall biosynthesis